MKKTLFLAGLVTALSSPISQAAEFKVKVENLTHGMYYTPLLVAAHVGAAHLFRAGEAASEPLATMAEGGDIDPLVSVLDGIEATYAANPANGLLAPGAFVETDTLNTDNTNNQYLSVVAMLLPTNDGFVGLDSYPIPTESGIYTVYLNAYDAGSEANDEIINGGGALGVPGIPADPGENNGSGGSGVTDSESNTNVHIHRGNLGDTDREGGISDLDSRVHRWLNPVARVTITVR